MITAKNAIEYSARKKAEKQVGAESATATKTSKKTKEEKHKQPKSLTGSSGTNNAQKEFLAQEHTEKR